MVIFFFALAMLSAITLFFFRSALFRRLWIFSIATVIVLISSGWIPQQIMPSLTASAVSSTDFINDNNVIVLLGGGLSTTTEGAEAIPFHAYSRISKAAELYQQCDKVRRSCRVLISGGSPADRPSEASEYAKFLIKLGIPASTIILEEKSQNTWQNAKFSQEMLKSFDSIIIVTNGLHARRTELYFRHFGSDATLISSDQFPIKLNPWQWGLNWFVFEVEIHEWTGIVRYHVYELLGLNKAQN